jgi:hypothetical protein
MRHLTRTALAGAATALLATGVAAITGVGVAGAQAVPVTTVGTDTVTTTLAANDVSMAFTYYRDMCAGQIVPSVRGTTPFYFETDNCVSGLLTCLDHSEGGGLRVVYYADHVTCENL